MEQLLEAHGDWRAERAALLSQVRGVKTVHSRFEGRGLGLGLRQRVTVEGRE